VRRALGADARGLLETVGADVLLAASGAVDVDVQRFETLAQSTATADLAAANELYRGEFLADFDVPSEPFMDWVRVERARLEAPACGILFRLAAALSEAGEHDAAIAAAERLVALDPVREDGHRLLMQLFASAGRRAEAVRQFAICKDSLRRKLDVAPDAKTIALAQAIQAQGPAQALAAGGGIAHVPAAVPADTEIPAPTASPSDHLHDVAGEAAAIPLPMVADATRRGAAMPTAAPAAAAVTGALLASPAGTKDGVVRKGRANTRWPIRALATFSVVAACVAAAGAGIWRISLSNFDGTWSVYLACQSVGAVEIKPREHTEFAGQAIDYDAPDAGEIPCMTLDSLGLARVDLIKIDVEGMEMNVLAGAAALIGKHRPAMVVEHIKTDAEKLRRWLEALDYRVLVSGINFVAIHNSDPGLASIQVKG